MTVNTAGQKYPVPAAFYHRLGQEAGYDNGESMRLIIYYSRGNR